MKIAGFVSAGRLLGLAVVLVTMASQIARAQDVPLIPGLPPASSATTNQPPTPAEAEVPVEPEFASARATIRTFVESFSKSEDEMGADPMKVAVRCLDLGGLPQPLWESKGPELAIHLKSVIDRIEYVDPATVPDDPLGEPWVFYRSPEGEISIARRKSGRWLFTKETVASIPSLLRAFEQSPRLTEDKTEPALQTRYQLIRQLIPRTLRNKWFILEHWQWIALFAFAGVGGLIWRGTGWLLTVAFGGMLRRRWESLTDDQVRKGFNPVGMLLMAVLWLYGLSWLGLPLWMHTVLLVAMRFVAVTATVFVVFAVLELFMSALRKRASKADSTIDLLLVPLVRTSMRIVIAVVAIAVFADNFDVEITGLLAGLGLGGVAIALAAKDTLGNFFGSLTVILDKPFRAGDWVKIGTVEGQVEEVGLRSTRIRTAEDSLVTMPNLTLTVTAVENFGMRRWRRWKTTLVLGHATATDRIEKLCEGIVELVKARPATMRQDGVTAAVSGFTPAAIEVAVVVFFEAPDAATENRLRHEFALELLRLAERLGIEFAEGMQTVVVMPNGEPGEEKKRPALID